MGMLKSISLENYKCFKDETTIDIAPLTVLCGANSSGKSSILKSLLTLKQSVQSNNSEDYLTLNGELADIGNFNDIMSRCSSNNISDTFEGLQLEDIKSKVISFENTFRINNYRNKNIGKYIPYQDAASYKELRRLYNKEHSPINSFEITLKLNISLPDDVADDSFSKFIYSNHLVKYKINIKLFDINNCEITRRSGVIEYENNILHYENIPTNNSISEKGHLKCKCSFSSLKINNIYSNFFEDYKSVLYNIMAISKIASNQFLGINYIAPLRNNPERDYFIKGNSNTVGIYGEFTPTIIAKNVNEDISTETFPPIFEDCFLKHDMESINFFHLLLQWTDYFNFGSLTLNGTNGHIDLKIGEQNIVDVGFGVSQVLPIIVQGLIMDKEQSLLLEQPEIHLHPKLQMRIADFFIAMAQSGRSLIIETHSDHIINRIVRRILEDDTNTINDLVHIYYLEKENKFEQTKITPIKIDSCRGIIDWPDGFFDQFPNEQEKIIRAGIEKRRYLREKI